MKKKSYLEHAAVTVDNIDWCVDFFKNALGMEIVRKKEYNGRLHQVWLSGGLQLIASDYIVKHADHLGIVVQDFEKTLKDMLSYEGVRHIEGKPEKWVKLPNGLVLELFQEKPGAIEKVLSIEVK